MPLQSGNWGIEVPIELGPHPYEHRVTSVLPMTITF
jgi:hypothetical protein